MDSFQLSYLLMLNQFHRFCYGFYFLFIVNDFNNQRSQHRPCLYINNWMSVQNYVRKNKHLTLSFMPSINYIHDSSKLSYVMSFHNIYLEFCCTYKSWIYMKRWLIRNKYTLTHIIFITRYLQVYNVLIKSLEILHDLLNTNSYHPTIKLSYFRSLISKCSQWRSR